MAKKKERIKIICENCGEEFEVLPWRANSAKYCSRKCVNEVVKNKMIEYHKENNSTTISKVCKNELCKKQFTVKPEFIRQKYCCFECYLESRTPEYKNELLAGKKIEEIKKINKIWKL